MYMAKVPNKGAPYSERLHCFTFYGHVCMIVGCLQPLLLPVMNDTRDKITRTMNIFMFQDCWGSRTQARDQTGWLAKACNDFFLSVHA